MAGVYHHVFFLCFWPFDKFFLGGGVSHPATKKKRIGAGHHKNRQLPWGEATRNPGWCTGAQRETPRARHAHRETYGQTTERKGGGEAYKEAGSGRAARSHVTAFGRVPFGPLVRPGRLTGRAATVYKEHAAATEAVCVRAY